MVEAVFIGLVAVVGGEISPALQGFGNGDMLGYCRVLGRARAVGGAVEGVCGLSLGERRVEECVHLGHHAVEDRQCRDRDAGDGSALFRKNGLIADGSEGEHGGRG